MQNTTIAFIGHKKYFGPEASLVSWKIEKLIQEGYRRFLCGGTGQFDWICARCVYELKKHYPHIRSELVIPYLSFHIAERSYFDAVVFPDGFEQYNYIAAISKRNQYLVDNAAAAICYINYNWGRSAKRISRQ